MMRAEKLATKKSCMVHAPAFLRQLSRVAAKHTSRDSTKCGLLARSFSEHHSHISHAIVMTDALNI